jgi:TPR repeat protein
MEAKPRSRAGMRMLPAMALFVVACVPRSETLRQSCNGGNMQDCVNLGDMYAAGRNVAKDGPRAAALFKQGCDSGEMRGCYQLARTYATGDGVPKDEERGAMLFQQMCDRGGMTGCMGLGEMYATGRGVPKDEPRATVLFEQVCKSDSTISIVDGQNRPKDAAFLSTCVSGLMDSARAHNPSSPEPH